MAEPATSRPASVERATLTTTTPAPHLEATPAASVPRWAVIAMAAVIAAALAIARDPTLLLSPVFWAEDGRVWFQQAYNSGWASLIQPNAGYLGAVPRFLALLVVHVPLNWAALLDMLVALSIQVLPVCLLLSRRSDTLGPLRARIAIALVYSLLACAELDSTITNSTWHLDLAVLIIVLRRSPTSVSARIGEVALLAASGLSGPQAIVVIPIAFAMWWRERNAWIGIRAGVITGCGAIQLTILHLAAARYAVSLGATASLFLRLLANRVISAGSLDLNTQQTVSPAALVHGGAICGILVLAALALAIWAMVRAPFAMKALLFFCAALTMAGLLSPLGSWGELLPIANSGRYFFAAEFGWVVLTLWAATTIPRRIVSSAVLIGLGVAFMAGTVAQWSYPPLANEHLSHYQEVLQSAPPGTLVTIPIDPAGWIMTLAKPSP